MNFDFIVGFGGGDYFGFRGIGADFDLAAKFAIDLDGYCQCVTDQILLIPLRPVSLCTVTL